MKIDGLLHPEDIICELKADNKSAVLAELATRAAEQHPGLSCIELLKILEERERLGSTGIGDGIAIPHGKVRRAGELVLVFGRSREGVEFNALDGRKVHLLFLLVAPEEAVGLHLKMLARISRLLKDPSVRRGLLDAPDADAICHLIREQDSRY